MNARLAPLFALVLLLAACGDGVITESGTDSSTVESTAPGAPTTVVESTPEPNEPQPLNFEASHRDLVDARAELDAARQRWEQAAIEDYSLQVSQWCECDGWIVESVVLRDDVHSSRFVRSPDFPVSDTPKTVDDLFARAERLLADLEADPSSVAKSDCDGSYLDLAFDPETGVPTLSSNNTPCDGGAAWGAKFQTVDPESDAPLVELDEYTRVALGDLGELTFPRHDGLVIVYSEGFDVVDYSTRTEQGTPCSFAVDEAACLAEIEQLLADPIDASLLRYDACGNCLTGYLTIVATSGSTVELVSADSLQSVLGPVDTPSEALLVVGQPGWARAVEDDNETAAYEIVTTHLVADCDPIIDRFAVSLVDERGWANEVDRWFEVAWGVCN